MERKKEAILDARFDNILSFKANHMPHMYVSHNTDPHFYIIYIKIGGDINAKR
jgi:hypothetical protein